MIEFSDSLTKNINFTNDIFNKTLDKYKLNEIFLSFNGGKDCTLLLDTFLKLYHNRRRDGHTKKESSSQLTTSTSPHHLTPLSTIDSVNSDHNEINPISSVNGNDDKENQLTCIYIQSNNPFEEVDCFIKECERRYSICIYTYQGEIKETLTRICKDYPNLKACLMGSRRTDPYCGNLQVFQETDSGWPKLMRIHPILDWNYENVWEYLLKNNVKYCNLYDRGYTSIGEKSNTILNPLLRYYNEETKQYEYKPAYELESPELERNGRL